MSTADERHRMAAAIINFEARRDNKGRLKVYELPPEDGGGRYEVAGINEKYNKETVDALVEMLRRGHYDEAEAAATEFVAQDTDRVTSWSSVPSLEFYLRDCCVNRGFKGAGRILQRALNLPDSGLVDGNTKIAVAHAETNPVEMLESLRKARESYEREVVHRDETSKFWLGLVNRWNNSLKIAMTFPSTSPRTAMPVQPTTPVAPASPLPIQDAPDAPPATLAALREGSKGDRVAAWQSFLVGRDFDTGPIDGSFEEHTRDATKAFQEKYNLTVDGVAGAETLIRAAKLGLPLIETPASDNTSSNFPPRPSFPPLATNAQRQTVFGAYNYVPAPEPGNAEAIRILGGWEQKNIVPVHVPQLGKALGRKSSTIEFHRLAAAQLQGMWAEWETAKLLDRLVSYDGSFVPRFVRGSRSVLSNHAFGSAFDVNATYNKLGHEPALVGRKGSVRELVQIANKWGFYWGGHYNSRKDGMHFEVAYIKA
jgi:peptidoglycan hydrolase-like protein with peptidoglycan-binding domain